MTSSIEVFKPSLIGDTHQLGPSNLQSEAFGLLNDSPILSPNKLLSEPAFLSFDNNIYGATPTSNDSTADNASTATPFDKPVASSHSDAPAIKSDGQADGRADVPLLPVPGQIQAAHVDAPLRPQGAPEGHSGPVPPRFNATHDWNTPIYKPQPVIDETVKRAN